MSDNQRVINNTVSAKNQVDENVFYLGSCGLRVMILGNSITLHNPKADIGWYGKWGMAASSADKDYVHQLYYTVTEHFGNTQFCVVQASDWELNFNDDVLSEKFSKAKSFAPDVLVFRLGENIHPDKCSVEGLYEAIGGLLSYFCTSQTKIVFTTRFMPDEKVDDIIRRFAKEHKCPLAELGDMGHDYSMLAFDKFEHGGVASHPGDKGMSQIADRIWQVFPR